MRILTLFPLSLLRQSNWFMAGKSGRGRGGGRGSAQPVAMWLLLMLSPLPHLPDLELGAVDDGYMHEECVEGA